MSMNVLSMNDNLDILHLSFYHVTHIVSCGALFLFFIFWSFTFKITIIVIVW